MNTQTDHSAIAVKIILKNWETQNKVVIDFFNKYDNDHYLQEVAPGRNRALYLLGHLTAINDGILPLFTTSDKMFPQLESLFVANADKKVANEPPLEELKSYWKQLNQTLGEVFNVMETNDWYQRHNKVSEEDFAADPTRNKLGVLAGRVNHEAHHAGQLALLNPRA